MLIIGIAGVPAGGKSTVAAQLADLGATWINADQIAHEVLQRPEVAARVASRFGGDIVDASGQIDRSKLAQRVFGDDDASVQGLRYLESVIHPLTRQAILDQLALADAANAPAAVLDIPLLFESGWANQCDEIWFVDTAPAIQSAAAEARQWTPQNLELRQSQQLSSQEKRRLSTRIIPNHEGISALKSHVERLWNHCVNSSAIEGPQSAAENHCRPSRTRGH